MRRSWNSGCLIYIQFDRKDKTYLPGDLVSGAVRVTARKKIKCHKLVLHIEWRLEGKGKSEEGHGRRIIFNEETTWQKESKHAYPRQNKQC